MLLIWYNPDLDCFEKGSSADLASVKNGSSQKEKFDVLYEFNVTSEQLANRILNTLNQIDSTLSESM